MEGTIVTAAEQAASALAALDQARRALEALAAKPCRDGDIDGAIGAALDDIDAHIGELESYRTECVLGPDMGDFYDPADSFPSRI